VPNYNLTDGDDSFRQSVENRDLWENVYGLAGDDLLAVYNGVLSGGAGSDVLEALVYQQQDWRGVFADYGGDPSGVVVDLQSQTAIDGWGNTDTLINIRNINGSPHSDRLVGSDKDNFFNPGLGNDTVIGGAGYDGISLPWWSPGPGLPWSPVRLDDLNVEVSPDGTSALLTLKGASSASWALSGIEFIDIEIRPGEGRRIPLTEFITYESVARQAIAAGPEYRWNPASPLGSGTTLTFSFVTQAPSSGIGSSGFRAFSEAERTLVRDLLKRTQDLTDLQFTEVSETSSIKGQLRFGVSQQLESKGLTWLPGLSGAGDLSGDVWMDVESMRLLQPGQEGYAALLHEIGHALGLRHPRSVDPQDNWSLQAMPSMDVTSLTVMSQTASADGLFRADWGPLDIAALRHLYGARSVQTGDDTYRLTDADGAWQRLIVDDGGVDWLDASALASGANISLDASRLSSAGISPAGVAGIGNVALGVGTLIENALGTPWDDVLLGNSSNNLLRGGLGNDWIDGGSGIDTAVFEGKLADYEVINNYGKLFVVARDGAAGFDTLLNVEKLQFADQVRSLESVRIEGVPVQGNTLRAVLDLLDLSGTKVTGYQWKVNDQPIPGATGDTLVLGQQHVSRTITVTAYFESNPLEPQSLTSVASSPVADTNDLPSGYVRVLGQASEGQILKAEHRLTDADGGNADPSGNLYVDYQWRADGVDLPGATGAKLLLTQYLVGKKVELVASYWDWQGHRELVTSAATARVGNVNQSPEGTVSISGVAAVGQTLQATTSVSDRDGLGPLRFQWRADGQVLTGGNQSSLTVTSAMSGKRIDVVASFTDGQGTAESVVSRTTSPVTSDSQIPRGDVSISGAARQGKTLTATHTLSDPDGISSGQWVWFADNLPLDQAAGATLQLTQEHVGRSITAAWAFRDSRGNFHEIASPSTNPVRNVNDAPTGSVVIDGAAVQGGVLQARVQLQDVDGLGTFSYRWLADGVVLVGAESDRLTLTQSQVGRRIQAEVQYVDPFGTTETVQSAATAPASDVNDSPAGTLSIWNSEQPPAQGWTLWVNDQISDPDGVGAKTYTWWAGAQQIGTGDSVQLTQSAVGKPVTVVASYVDGQGHAESVRSPATLAVTNTNDSVVGWVRIEGEATVGRTLSMVYSVSDLDGPGPVSLEWQGNGRVVATGPTLLLDRSYEWMSLRAIVRFTDQQGSEEWLQSDSSRPVAGANASPKGSVQVEGAAVQGSTVKARAELTDADGMGTLAYQWQSDRIDIPGATGVSFAIGAEQVGLPLNVIVSYTDGHGVRESVTSSATVAVRNVNDAPMGEVRISGLAQQGQTLVAYHTLSDADGLGQIDYEWLLNGQPVAGAKSNTLLLGEFAVGQSVRLRLSYTDGQGTREQVLSLPTGLVQNINEPMVGTVVLLGNAVVGSEVQASAKGSDPDGPGTLTYRWVANGQTILEGPAARFTIPAELALQTLKVIALQTDAHGTPEQLASDDVVIGRSKAAEPGAASVEGTLGADVLRSASAGATLHGLQGADLLEGGTGNDTLRGGEGADRLIGGGGFDRAKYVAPSGATGNFYWVTSTKDWGQATWQQPDESGAVDVLSGIEGLWLVGAEYGDVVFGSPGDDLMEGGPSNDQLRGAAGNDDLRGGQHNDDLRGGAGADSLDGGDDWDTVSYEDDVPLSDPGALDGIRAVMARGQIADPWGQTDTVKNIEGVIGTSLDDVIDFSGANGGWMRGMAGYDRLIGSSSWDHVDYSTPWGEASVGLSGIDLNLVTGVAYDSWGFRDTLVDVEGVSGSSFDDRLVGDGRNNSLDGNGGNDFIDGGAGFDTTRFHGGPASDYRVRWLDGGLQVADTVPSRDGTDMLLGIERVSFHDLTLNLTVGGTAKSIPQASLDRIAELYVAFFNRVPDGDGMEYWIGEFRNGKSINEIAEAFYNAGVFFGDITGYRAGMTNADFVNVVYRNVLGRPEGADAAGLSHWTGQLGKGVAKGVLVSTILDAAHGADFSNPANPFHWVQKLLDNKLKVAKQVALAWGVNYNSPEDSISKGMAIAAAVTSEVTIAAIGLVGVDVAAGNL
jgi:Ca2+-binding RTX toxin-like protein